MNLHKVRSGSGNPPSGSVPQMTLKAGKRMTEENNRHETPAGIKGRVWLARHHGRICHDG